MKWYLKAFRQYADFSGRSRRTEYWMFTLFQVFFAAIAILLDVLLGTTIEPLPYGIIFILYAMASFIPGVALSVRRLQDLNKSGWMLLIGLIPLAGAIWLFILMCLEGTKGENLYGFDPKEEEIY